MALKLWLPLIKDIRQQGLSNSVATNNGSVTYNSTDGKLGGCYTFSGSNSISIPEVILPSQTSAWSFACWFKLANTTSTAAAALFSERTGGNANGYTIFIYPNSSQMLVDDGARWSVTPMTFSANVWYHLVVTRSTSGKKIYINGVLKSSTTTVGNTSAINTNGCLIGLAQSGTSLTAGNQGFIGSLNDVRIYNHCLSPMEVKQISQGLVLHYPLNRNSWGQENLAMDSHDLTHTCAKENKYISKRRTADVIQLRSDGFYECKSFSTSFGGLAIYANQFNLSSGDILTYSFYVYTDGSTKSLSFYPMMYNSSGSRDTSSTLSISLDGGSYTAGNSKSWGSINNTIPQKHWVTFVWNETMESIISNGGKIELSIQPHGTWNNANEYVCLFAPKLEVGSIPTSWCPNSSDALATTMGLNSTIEYDCSGFCNNGTRTGTFNWTSDTPKYSVSSVQSSSNYISLASSPTSVETIAVWAKWNTIPSGRSVILVDYGSGIGLGLTSTGILCSTSNAGNSYTFSKANLVANTWYHFVVVKTGTTTRKLYINGIEQTATSNTSQWTFSINELQLGKRSSTSDGFIGKLSDFRAYATALSADDVLSLYQNSAYIDSSGNVYGTIHEV